MGENQCVCRLVAEQAGRSPDAVALVHGQRSLTYKELNDGANRLARYLQRLGVGPGQTVAVCLKRTPELITSLLAIWKAGAAYVPMDPAYPPQRLSYMLEDSGAGVLIAPAELQERLPLNGVRLLSLETEQAAVAAESGSALEGRIDPGALAYVIFTSGSTGRPKGVEIEHRSLANTVTWFAAHHDLRVGDRTGYTAGIGFDASVIDIWAPLISGAAVHLPDEETRLSPERLQAWILQQGLSVVFAPTPMAELLLALDWPAEAALRVLYTGGDKLQRYLPAGSPFRLSDNYGPTECACIVTQAWIGQQQPGPAAGAPPIGHPIAGMQVHLLDQHLLPVPAGTTGEIYAAGPGVGRGYRGRPDLTAERFMPDPHSSEPGARMYRTGDLGRLRPDGQLECLGRLDEQIKVRGFRVELGEIEVVLQQHPAVAGAVALLRSGTGEARLVAYVVPKAGTLPGIRELRNWLSERLPAYMVPAAILFLSALPLTAHGKVDREALPDPDWSLLERDQPYEAPCSATEAALAAIWAEVLAVGQVSRHDDFFALGGHSLRATQILVRVREALGVDLPVLALFEHPTVERLALAVEAARAQAEGADDLGLQQEDRNGSLPLGLSQEPIWFFQQLSPGLMSYNFQASLRFRGRLDVAVLERALTEIIRRHEIFRTTFPAVDGRPVQLIHPPFAVTLPVEEVGVGQLEQRLAAEFGRPFDLTVLPLVCWRLFRVGPADYVLAHVEHHLVHDGWSFTTFLRELRELYLAFSAGKPSPLPELPCQFADFAAAQRRWLEGPVAARQREYWKSRLAGTPPVLELPADRPRPVIQRYQGEARRVQLPEGLAERVRAFGRQSGVSLYMTMLAAFQTLLYRYSGQRDFCTGAGVANRRWRATEGLIGMVINTVALRADLAGNPTFRELLGRVKRTTLEAFANQDLPFDRVVEALQPERSLSHLPIYQVAFSFHDSPMPDMELPGLSVEVFEGYSNGSTKFDLNVVVLPRAEQRLGQSARTREGDVTVVWEYDTDLFEPATIQRMIDHYHTLLAALVADPEQRVAEVPLLSGAERAQLEAWSQTEAAARSDRPVHLLVAEQARRHPAAVAVSGPDETLTYADLDRRAGALAARLKALGVGPDQPAAIVLERSAAMVTAMLAVLKAGGAYLPLDPSLPAPQMAHMLADSGALVVITTRSLAERLQGGAPPVVFLDDLSIGEWNQADGTVEQNLAYLIYTSGSTGLPKAVAVSHGSLSNLIAWHRQTFGVTGTDRAAQVAGQGFDACVWEIWPYLSAGASVTIVPDAVRLVPERLRDWLAEHAITIAFLPTPLAEAVLALPWPESIPLRTLLTGGDKLHSYPLPGLPFALVNNYGPTECTVVATSSPVAPGGSAAKAPDIGRPIAGTRAWLVDEAMQLVLPGVPGELLVGGRGVAHGYVGRPDLTAERFVPDPLSGEFGGRLYRTGDQARWLPDGTLQFLGRTDFQVKIRGLRIELGEIEVALSRHPSVREAVVMAREDQPGERRLVAYVVAEPPAPAEELRRFLLERLPAPLVPGLFVMLDRLPLTHSGKVDRRALPAPAAGDRIGEERYVPPRSPVEIVLAEIWAEVLQVERVGLRDNFFHLGGHSLLMTRIATRVRDRLGVELPLRVMFEAPTVAELAGVVVGLQLAQRSDDEIERLLASLEELPDEEVRRRLGSG